MNPDTLRTYAAVLRLPYRGVDGKMHMAGEVMMIAAEAMDFMARAIERDDPRVPPGYRNRSELPPMQEQGKPHVGA